MQIQDIINWIILYKYPILFLLTVIEGPIVTVITGFLATLGYINAYIAYAIIVSGDLTGDVIYYIFGRIGQEKFLEKWGRYIGVSKESADKIKKHFSDHGGKTLLLGKLAHGIGAVFLFAAGMSKMPFLRFLWFNLAATVVKSLALILIGFYFGQAITSINSILKFVSAITISFGIIAIFIWMKILSKKSV